MRVMVILAHPRKGSFNHAISRELCAGLAASGHDVDLADLYAEGFRPHLDAEDIRLLDAGDAPADIRGYRERVAAARALAFIFPVWWFAPPAMMKGFVDRVFYEGFAFRFGRGRRAVGLLTHERALVLNTTGAGNATNALFGFGAPLDRTFCDWTLSLCGIRDVKRVVLPGVEGSPEAKLERHLKKARRLGKEFFG